MSNWIWLVIGLAILCFLFLLFKGYRNRTGFFDGDGRARP